MFLKKVFLLLFPLLFVQVQCKSQNQGPTYSTETLKIVPISKNSFVHISYLNTNDFGKVACNGLIYISDGEAIIFDTPTNDQVSEELINWLRESKQTEVKAVVINHFHVDCLGGLQAFHDLGISSYANNTTIQLANNGEVVVPKNGFDIQNELNIGGKKVINRFFGEAHTKDNIISYIPEEQLVFGGCMIKSLKAPKGNLEDATITEWSKTVQKIKDGYPDLKTVVPGHGAYGNTQLLDYTIALFNVE